MDIINKRGESPETLPVIEKRPEIIKPRNIRFKFDGNLNRKVWVPRRTDKRGRDEVAAIDLELFFRINEKKRWGGGYFDFRESKPSSSKEQKKTPEQSMNEPEPTSSTEESEVAKSSSNFAIADRKGYGIAEKTIHYIQTNYVIKKPNTKSTKAEKLKKAEFNFMIDLKTLIQKISVEIKLLQLKVCVRNKQRDRAPEEISSLYREITERFGLLFAGDRIVVPEELKRPVVDAFHFGHPGSPKMLAESSTFWWSGMKKDIENKYSTCTACMNSGKNLKYQLLSTGKIKIPALTEPGQEIQFDSSGKLHHKHVTGEPYILIGIDR